MSQANPIIGANKSGLSYRQEDNDGKQALLNHHKGASAPEYAEAGMLWLDDAATPWRLRFYDGADWIDLCEINPTTNTVLPYLGNAPLRVPMLVADTGTANNYKMAPTPAVASYASGQMYLLKPGNNNSGSSNLAVSSLSPVSIKMPNGSNTPAGSLLTSGLYLIVHNGTNFVVLNPTTPSISQVLDSVSDMNNTSTQVVSVAIPADDTIPQSSEGMEILSASITPKSTSSKIVIKVSGFLRHGNVGISVVALFRNSETGAIYAMARQNTETANIANHSLVYVDEPNTTSAILYKVRVGAPGQVQLNASAGRLFGGKAAWTLLIEEHAG